VADLLLLRHASAGPRPLVSGVADLERPLDARGGAQATALVELLAPTLGDAPDLVTSPAMRCRETVAPLAGRLGSHAVVDEALAEGCDVTVLLARVQAGIARPTLWVSHGDVIPELLAMLVQRGLDLGPDVRFQKASTWVLHVEDGVATAARHIRPPA